MAGEYTVLSGLKHMYVYSIGQEREYMLKDEECFDGS